MAKNNPAIATTDSKPSSMVVLFFQLAIGKKIQF
jgi:hypothetical protein